MNKQGNTYDFADAAYSFHGLVDKTMRFVENVQLKDAALWKRFVEQFRVHSDSRDAGWRGEFWGKMMRGACFVYSYTQSPELYEILTKTVMDMLESSDEDNRISSYTKESEFIGWDIWGRKYVLLGMQYYMEICSEEALKERITASMRGQVDYIMSKIGPVEEGKKPITAASNHWRGLNSCSLLEPVVRLYKLTKEDKYLAFAEYIVGTGGTSVENFFQLAYENKFYPYQYPVTKAYEMISCFEGLLEFYRVKKIEWHKTAILNFANRILEADFTIIGTAGCTNEFFDHSTVRQANPSNDKTKQETCVTVTLMKFFYQLTLLTGDAVYADAFERAFYNAYLGSLNTEAKIEQTVQTEHPELVHEPMPFDSYSPLTAGERGYRIGGFRVMPDNHYYGCCACIGAAGIGLVPKMTLMKCEENIVINMYFPGKMEVAGPCGSKVILRVDTEYPKDASIKIQVETDCQESFGIYLRNPEWSKITTVQVNGESALVQKGYVQLERCWKTGDEILLTLDMRTEAVYPIPYGHEILMNKVIWGQNYMVATYDEEDPEAKNHMALRRGPLVLAVDSCFGVDVENIFEIKVQENGYVMTAIPKTEIASYEHIVEVEVPLQSGKHIRLTDYASAGKKWSGNQMAAWMRVAGKTT